MSYTRYEVLMTPEKAAKFLQELAEQIIDQQISVYGYTDDGVTGDDPVVKLESMGFHKWMLPALAESVLKDVGGVK